MSRIEPAQLKAWFEAHGSVLVLYARQWLPWASAEDVVQDVFCRLMNVAGRPDNAKAWLFRAVRNAAIGQLRSQRRRRRHESRTAIGATDWFDPKPDDLIDAATVQSTLASLPEPQREVIVLRIWADLPLREIERITGTPVSTLHSRYRAGLAALRNALEAPCKTNPN